MLFGCYLLFIVRQVLVAGGSSLALIWRRLVVGRAEVRTYSPIAGVTAHGGVTYDPDPLLLLLLRLLDRRGFFLSAGLELRTTAQAVF